MQNTLFSCAQRIGRAIQSVQMPVKQWPNTSTDHSRMNITSSWLASTALTPSLMVGAGTLWYLAKLTTTSFRPSPEIDSNTLAPRVLRVKFLTISELLWRTKWKITGFYLGADEAQGKALLWKWYNSHTELIIYGNIHVDYQDLIWLHKAGNHLATSISKVLRVLLKIHCVIFFGESIDRKAI